MVHLIYLSVIVAFIIFFYFFSKMQAEKYASHEKDLEAKRKKYQGEFHREECEKKEIYLSALKIAKFYLAEELSEEERFRVMEEGKKYIKWQEKIEFYSNCIAETLSGDLEEDYPIRCLIEILRNKESFRKKPWQEFI